MSTALGSSSPLKGSRFHESEGNLLGEVAALDLLGPKYLPMNGITRPRLHAMVPGLRLLPWQRTAAGNHA
jgi:hypothetical protein